MVVDTAPRVGLSVLQRSSPGKIADVCAIDSDCDCVFAVVLVQCLADSLLYCLNGLAVKIEVRESAVHGHLDSPLAGGSGGSCHFDGGHTVRLSLYLLGEDFL